MTPTSRNSLMVGGAAIVVALMLTCGPLQGIFGGGDSSVAEAPAVAAGPPADVVAPVEIAAPVAIVAPVEIAAPAAIAAAAGAVAGASIGGADAAAVSNVIAPTAVSIAPAVSAGPPIASVAVANTTVLNPVLAAAAASAAATQAFDQAYVASGTAAASAAGKVVDRFAPPVAAIASSTLALNGIIRSVGLAADSIRQPCDSPGAGCMRGTIAPPNLPTDTRPRPTRP